MLRQPRDRKDAKAIDESTDTYDTIEWLLANVRGHNGRVGMVGTSYPAWLAVMGALDPHPALAAIVPQASPADMWLGDDFHHNGAFRLSYGLEYAYMMESSKEITNPATLIDRHDTYDWYLELGSLANANRRYFRESLPSWNDFVRHPDYDAFWKRQAFAPWLNRVTVPTLNVAGWWDQEDFYGPIKIYELFERHDTKGENFLVVGPWNHGGWSRGAGPDAGPHRLRQRHRRPLPPQHPGAFLRALSEREGTRARQRSAHVSHRRERVGGARSVAADRRMCRRDACTSAKAASSRFRRRRRQQRRRSTATSRIRRSQCPTGRGRSDCARAGAHGWSKISVSSMAARTSSTTSTEPLTEDVVVSGQISAHLFAATSGTDSDWIVKLIDVYPDKYAADETMGGYQLMIAGDVVRGRYHKSIERPEPLVADAVVKYEIPFPANDHVFRKGHRIMVHVQSTWFPVIDRNPQRFVPNIFAASDADFRRATQRIYRSGQRASHIALPTVSGKPGPLSQPAAVPRH